LFCFSLARTMRSVVLYAAAAALLAGMHEALHGDDEWLHDYGPLQIVAYRSDLSSRKTCDVNLNLKSDLIFFDYYFTYVLFCCTIGLLLV